jgi:CubicO group peptidase (beta-lactamase class C family)
MNQEKVTELEHKINNEYRNIAGVIVRRNGKVLYENYFNNCTVNSQIHVYSVSKSIISILIGIAIDKGYIENIDQNVLDFFPHYIIEKREQTIQNITLKNLLTMTAPYKYKFIPYTIIKYFRSSDWIKFTLDLLGGKEQIGHFRYTPLIGPDILSGILVKATGRSVLDFATEHLFQPLGITVERSMIFKTIKEQQAFNKSMSISGWVSDKAGINAGGWSLTLSATDMAKIGQLFLNSGMWDEQQLVSPEWINESTVEHSRWEKINLPFGYLWWIIDDNERAYAAVGDGGNVIYVNTKKNIVISIASLFKSKVDIQKDRLELIKT